jgi:hypothetical protein
MKITKKDLLNELISKQKKNISDEFLLSYKDLNRVVKNIDNSIFGDECCLWKGYVITRQSKHYINFFYKGIKVNLIRLLYQNFVNKIENNEYIKNSCASGGKCCNVNHYEKYINENSSNKNNSDENNSDENNSDENNSDENNSDENKYDENKYDENKYDENTSDDFKVIF